MISHFVLSEKSIWMKIGCSTLLSRTTLESNMGEKKDLCSAQRLKIVPKTWILISCYKVNCSSGVPNLFWPKIYFSSSQHLEIYNSIVHITNPNKTLQPAVAALQVRAVRQDLNITLQHPKIHNWPQYWLGFSVWWRLTAELQTLVSNPTLCRSE